MQSRGSAPNRASNLGGVTLMQPELFANIARFTVLSCSLLFL